MPDTFDKSSEWSQEKFYKKNKIIIFFFLKNKKIKILQL